MNNQDDAGSLERVALPAEGGSKGGSDSRSETLSTRGERCADRRRSGAL